MFKEIQEIHIEDFLYNNNCDIDIIVDSGYDDDEDIFTDEIDGIFG